MRLSGKKVVKMLQHRLLQQILLQQRGRQTARAYRHTFDPLAAVHDQHARYTPLEACNHFLHTNSAGIHRNNQQRLDFLRQRETMPLAIIFRLVVEKFQSHQVLNGGNMAFIYQK